MGGPEPGEPGGVTVTGGTARRLRRDGVWLHAVEWGSGARTLVLLHGLGGTHHNLAPQAQHFSTTYHVLAVDLRGHGRSDGPMPSDAIDTCAADVAWQCRHLDATDPVLVGHSGGGHVAAQLAADHPDLATAMIFLDSSLVFPPDRRAAGRAWVEEIRGADDPEPAIREFAARLFVEGDDPAIREHVADAMVATSWQTLVAMASDLLDWRAHDVLGGRQLPMLYIGSRPHPELDALWEACPGLEEDWIDGTGHFLPLTAPDQVNASIEWFLNAHRLG